jgi:hypothetical protein
MSAKSPFMRVLSAIWSGLDVIRKVLHLVLMLFIFLMFFGLTANDPVVLTTGSALVIEPYCVLVEQL